jgi:hypothetical protein
MGKNQDPDQGSGINPDPGLTTRLKYLNSLMRIRDPGRKKFGSGIRDGKNSDQGSVMEKIRIRDNNPGSATLDKSQRSGRWTGVPLRSVWYL